MLLETFQLLSHLGFPIQDYQYTGLGSLYFVDFIMMHKLLGIKRLLSVEIDDTVRKRIAFNQPFRCVDVRMGDISDYIPKLSPRRRHIVWLDYDNFLIRGYLEALWIAAARLPHQSIILITVDVEPPVKNGTPRKWREYFRDQASQYLGNLGLRDFAQANLVRVNRDILVRAIGSGLATTELNYIPLFCFSYADGHEMLTVGGMIGTEEDAERLHKSSLKDVEYIQFDTFGEPYRIEIPRLTRKERLHLDKAMPAAKNWTLKEFELPPAALEAYRKIYRYLPTYAELVL